MRSMPFTAFARNQAWLEISLLLPWECPALPGRRTRLGRAHAGAPAPSARRRAELGSAGDLAAAAHLAVGRCPGGSLRKAAGAAYGYRSITHAGFPRATHFRLLAARRFRPAPNPFAGATLRPTYPAKRREAERLNRLGSPYLPQAAELRPPW